MLNFRSRKTTLKILLISVAVCMIIWIAFPKVSDWPIGQLDEGPYLTLETKKPPREGVVLLEGYGSASLTPRMWCALESAARAHRKKPVTLLMVSSLIKDTRILHVLKEEHPNLQLLHLQVEDLFEDTILEHWYKDKKWEDSYWPKSHFNDIIRWLVLKHYGGIYLDLDTVVLQSLSSLPNCTGLESDRWVAAGVLKFSPGHRIIEGVIERIAEHFDGTVWGANGPEVITEVLQQMCGMQLPSGETPLCQDVTVMPKRAFYPVPWWDWKLYVRVDPGLSRELLSDPSVYAIHVWNLHTQHVQVRLNSHQPYAEAARKHCPITVIYTGSVM